MSDLGKFVNDLVSAHEAWNPRYRDTVTVYSQGLLYASVCTSLDDKGVDEAMGALPATVTRGWTRSADATFDGGQPNPCPCEQRPDTHRHVLYEA